MAQNFVYCSYACNFSSYNNALLLYNGVELTAFNTKTSPTESLSGIFRLFDCFKLLVIHRDSRCGLAEAEKCRRLAKTEDLLGAF